MVGGTTTSHCIAEAALQIDVGLLAVVDDRQQIVLAGHRGRHNPLVGTLVSFAGGDEIAVSLGEEGATA